MSKLYRIVVLFVFMMVMISCATPATETASRSVAEDAQIARYPEAANFDQSGETTQVRYAGQKYDFGVILNPQALIEEIQK